MRAIFLSLLFLIAAFPAGAEEAAPATAPDWRLETGDGSSIRLSQEVKQQPVVIFFWATWCPYCKAFMPHLQSIRLEYGDQVKVLAIQIRDKKDAVAFIAEAGYDFVVFPNGDSVGELYDIQSTPGVILVDQEGLMQFDLRALPRYPLPNSEEKLSHGRKAAYLAPYWAAELRQAIDEVL